jgi:hypothetical protein
MGPAPRWSSYKEQDDLGVLVQAAHPTQTVEVATVVVVEVEDLRYRVIWDVTQPPRPHSAAVQSDPDNHVEMPDEDPHREDKVDLVGALIRAVDNMDQINAAVRASADAEAARQALMASPFRFTEVQALYVLDMQVRRQTQAARQDLLAELQRLKSPDR